MYFIEFWRLLWFTSSYDVHIQGAYLLSSGVAADKGEVYTKAKKLGYHHGFVKHKERQYAKGFTHTNTIEGFWSQLKRSIDGTYHPRC